MLSPPSILREHYSQRDNMKSVMALFRMGYIALEVRYFNDVLHKTEGHGHKQSLKVSLGSDKNLICYEKNLLISVSLKT